MKVVWYVLSILMLVVFWILPLGVLASFVQGSVEYTPIFMVTVLIMLYFVYLTVKDLIGR